MPIRAIRELSVRQLRGSEFPNLSPEEEDDMPKAIMDISELLTRVENDHDLMRDLLQIFKEEFPGHLKSLRGAVEGGDAEGSAAEAHTLKGMLSNLAARSAADAAARIEQLGRDRKIDELPEALVSLEHISKELLLQLDTCLVEVCG